MIEYHKNLSLENLPYINEEGLVCWEEFKDIPRYEGFYQVSDLGRVKALRKIIYRVDGSLDNKPERILKQMNNGNNYMSVELYKDGNQSRKYVHRLVMLSFVVISVFVNF